MRTLRHRVATSIKTQLYRLCSGSVCLGSILHGSAEQEQQGLPVTRDFYILGKGELCLSPPTPTTEQKEENFLNFKIRQENDGDQE